MRMGLCLMDARRSKGLTTCAGNLASSELGIAQGLSADGGSALLGRHGGGHLDDWGLCVGRKAAPGISVEAGDTRAICYAAVWAEIPALTLHDGDHVLHRLHLQVCTQDRTG